MEDIHSRRLAGSIRIPSVEVDAITEGIVLSVIAGTNSGEDWWLCKSVTYVATYSVGGALVWGSLLFPPWRVYSCPASNGASSSPRLSEVVEPYGFSSTTTRATIVLWPLWLTPHGLPILQWARRKMMMMIMLMLRKLTK